MELNKKFHPETLMMSFGYKPSLSEGAIKCPIFQTSTFAFRSAEEGKAFFELAYGLRKPKPDEEYGLIYSRINNPDLEILENRLTLWDEAEDCAVFGSGMSAVSTVLLEFLNPGDLLLYSSPLYGGTDHFIEYFLSKIGVFTQEFTSDNTEDELIQLINNTGKAEKLALIYVETPANPTNALIDLEMCARIARKFSVPDKKVILAVDNTYLGPLWQHPLKHGADFSIYSATKYIGGHSDVIAGAVCGSKANISRIKTLRTLLGNMAGPHTGWLLLRSLETLKVRMEQQAQNAQNLAMYLYNHPKVERVYYLGFLEQTNQKQYDIFKQQCLSAGAMLSFDIRGGEVEAFRFLNALKIIKLAVSLGSTESLAQHPASMTHVGINPIHREKLNITDKLIRISVGIENIMDLIWDFSQAFEKT